MTRLLEQLREAARREGFVMCGVTPAVAAPGFDDLVRWIEAGYAAEMDYFRSRLEAYRHPRHVMAGAKSVVVLARPYSAVKGLGAKPGYGRVARYAAAGSDYHDVIHAKLKNIIGTLGWRPFRRGDAGDGPPSDAIRARGIIDTAPLLERELAQLAGLGWRAKNTLLIRPGLGSYFFLACLLVDVELPYDQPFERFHCGTCTACLEACPTDAFPQPGVVDAGRCISYLTIEHRGPIPRELREGIGEWVFGCDVCQEVCPWNRKPSREAATTAGPLDPIGLSSLFLLTDEQFRQRFRRTPLWRARRRGLLRNAAIVLGNQRDAASEPALSRGLSDEEPIVRGAAAWALGRLDSETARRTLRRRKGDESDSDVQSEIEAALQKS